MGDGGGGGGERGWLRLAVVLGGGGGSGNGDGSRVVRMVVLLVHSAHDRKKFAQMMTFKILVVFRSR